MRDYIIIGQGIAGTLLSYFLNLNNKSHWVIDQARPNNASRVAAGLINPLSFKRYTPIGSAAQIFPAIDSFYRQLEEFTQASFWNTIPILKYLPTTFEQNDWVHKSDQYPAFFAAESVKEFPSFGKVLQSGYINTSVFLDSYQKKLQQQDAFLEGSVDYYQIKPYAQHVELVHSGKMYSAQKLIFCEGFQIVNNPFFQHISLSPTKGEVLTLQTEELLDLDYILHLHGFIIPLAKNIFKTGSTYDTTDFSIAPTENAKQTILETWHALFPKIPYKIIEHRAGIRPNARNRKPFLEKHPQHPSLFALNGLGSRGLAIGPRFMEESLPILGLKNDKNIFL